MVAGCSGGNGMMRIGTGVVNHGEMIVGFEMSTISLGLSLMRTSRETSFLLK